MCGEDNMAKTIKFTFEEQQLVLVALNRLCIILQPEDSRRQTVSELEDRIRKLVVIDEDN